MIVVTGASGTLGRHLVELLLAEGQRVAAVTRDPARASLPPGAEVVVGDPARPETLASALRGATALFLHPRAAGNAATQLAAVVREQGVTRVVALSAVNVDEPLEHQPSRYAGDRNKEAEDAAVESGLEWASLRASSFASNTIKSWSAQLRAGDVVRYVYAAFEESLIDERDLAAVAARALLTDELLGRRLVLTGPQSLTHARMVSILGDVLRRPLRFLEIAPDAAAEGLVQRGLPKPFVDALMARFARELGRPAPLTNDVERILGRPARAYAEWAADHAAAFRR